MPAAWNWFVGPILAGIIMGFAATISKDASGRLYSKGNFDWKAGLTGFVAISIIYLLVFVGRLGVRYLLRRFKQPD